MILMEPFKLSIFHDSSAKIPFCLLVFLSRNSPLAFPVQLFLPSLDKLKIVEMLISTKVLYLEFVLLQLLYFLRQEK